MDHQNSQFPNNEPHTPRYSFGDDVSDRAAVDERVPEEHAVSDISRSPSPEHRPTSGQLLPNGSTKEFPKSTTTSTAAGPAHRRRHTHLLRNWWLEIGACFTFILALLAIVVTLRPHQGKPLPQWPYSISINTLISVYVVVLKATVLLVTAEAIGQLKWRWFRNERPLNDIATYDAASRGPLGSLSLLWTVGLRHPLSSCGAIITILMLAIDPFAQQIIRYHSCSVSVNGPQAKASIPRTNCFAGSGAHVGAGEVSIGPPYQSSINAGIFSPGSFVNPLCTTGNCSFPDQYDTLGYCGSCTDITNSLKFDEVEASSDGAGSSATRDSIVSYLPSGLSINSTNPGGSVGQTGINHIGSSGESKNFNFATMGSTSFTGDGNPAMPSVAEIILAKSPYIEASGWNLSEAFNDTCQNGNSSWFCLGYGAARCTLNPCVRTYTGSITSGDFQENLISQADDTNVWASAIVNDVEQNDINDYQLATVDTKCISLADRTSLTAAGYRIDPAKRWLPYNLTLDPRHNYDNDSSFPASMLQRDCIYIMDQFTAGSLWSQYLAHFFNGTVSGATNTYGTVDVYTGPQNIQTIYNYGNITFERVHSIFRNISDSLTTYLRQNGVDFHSTPVTGVAYHDDTCLEVRWAWLAFPAALVLFTVLFFAITLILTRPTGDRVEVWKSSPLALIFHGLEAPNHFQGNSALQESKDMDRVAKGITVRLAPSANGGNLMAVGGKGSNGG